MKPIQMWEAIAAYARGAVPDISGASLMRQMSAFHWPSGTGDGTYKARVREALQQLRSLHDQADLLRNSPIRSYAYLEISCAAYPFFRHWLSTAFEITLAMATVNGLNRLTRVEVFGSVYANLPLRILAIDPGLAPLQCQGDIGSSSDCPTRAHRYFHPAIA